VESASRHTDGIFPVLLCGGSGTRLWPLSRTHLPKQFLRLVGHHSLLQDTVERVSPFCAASRLIAVANEDHRFMLAEQLREIGVAADILLEPVARNTAPAIAAAAQWALHRHPSPLLLVMPSDHLVADVEAFHRAVAAGTAHARAGKLVTFGIKPSHAETGYGYIQRGAADGNGYAISRFVEKPDSATASAYLASGEYYWNSGMFLFHAEAYLRELAQQVPTMADAARAAVEKAKPDLDFVRLDKEAFSASPADSIDYAVMEKTDDGIVIPLDAGWSDIGAWDALYPTATADTAGNLQQGDVLLHDTSNCYVRAGSRLVAMVGLSDTIVVETADAVLVADKSRAQDVKHIVNQLKKENRPETEFHTVVHRPWGSYEGVARGPRYQVKRIVVKPGRSLSLQKHHHRAEHWVVVSGTARAVCEDNVLVLSENQSTYIPLGAVHRLENPGKIDLEIIEVQSGIYLGEDDIVRFEDVYGREDKQ
jgi:mannose-1-phosphate guanylyltransferase/mannose-6-phosphate isomerase